MAPGSNRAGDRRSVIDPARSNIISLPIAGKQVTRRVNSEQVSSYHLRYHHRPGGRPLKGEDVERQDNRDKDPGEFELSRIEEDYRPFLKNSIAADPEFFIDRVAKKGGAMTVNIMSAAIGLLVHTGNIDAISRLDQFSSSIRQAIGDNMSRATARHFVREAGGHDLIDLFGPNKVLRGEMALNANTLYRMGLEPLRYVLGQLDDMLAPVDHIDLGHQQIFSTRSPNLAPSGVHPIKERGVDTMSVAGSSPEFLFSTKSGPDLHTYLSDSLGLQDSDGFSLYPIGSLPRPSGQAFRLLPDGIGNSSIKIPWSIARKVLQGFMARPIVYERGLNEGVPIFPNLSDNVLTSSELELRQKIHKLTSRKPTDALKLMREYGESGYGVDEIDLYNVDQFRWINGRRFRAGVEEVDLPVFPHPLLRLASMEYRDTDDDMEVTERLWALVISSLPLTSVRK